MNTAVTDERSLVKAPAAFVYVSDRKATIVDTAYVANFMERIEEVLRSGKFASGREWCRQAGISEGYLGTLKSRMGTGEVHTLKQDKAVKLARAAGVSVDWLMGADVPPMRPVDFEGSKNLETALEKIYWPYWMIPEDAAKIVQLVKEEAILWSAGQELPVSYWKTRINQLQDEVTGRTKPVVLSGVERMKTNGEQLDAEEQESTELTEKHRASAKDMVALYEEGRLLEAVGKAIGCLSLVYGNEDELVQRALSRWTRDMQAKGPAPVEPALLPPTPMQVGKKVAAQGAGKTPKKRKA